MEMLCAFWSLGFHKASLPVTAALPPACTKLHSNVHLIRAITGCIYIMHCVCTIFYPTGKQQDIWHAIPAIIWSAHCLASMQTALHFGVIVCLVFAIQMWLPFPLECINLRAAWDLRAVRNKSSFYAFNANKHKLHVICNAHAALCKLFQMHA